ncbi:major facilitator superfamily domain-containing protein 3 [Lampetra fluviatilis]
MQRRLDGALRSELAFLGALYCVQGMPYGLQSGYLPLYMRAAGASYGLAAITRVLYVPWLLKFAWAPLVGQCGSLEAWLLGSTGAMGLVCLVGGAVLPEPRSSLAPNAALLLLLNALASVQDVAVDTCAVRLLAGGARLAWGNAVQVVAYKLGSALAGGALLGLAGERLGWHGVLLVLGALYLLALAYTHRWLTWRPGGVMSPAQHGGQHDDGQQQQQRHRATFNPVAISRELLKTPGTAWMAVFVLLYKLGEQAALGMFPLALLERGFSTREVALWGSLVGVAISMAGSALGGPLCDRYSTWGLLRAALAARLVPLLTQTLLLSLQPTGGPLVKGLAVICILLQHLLGGLVTTLTFSLMMRCSQRAPPHLQATHYSFLALLEILGKLSLGTVSGLLLDSLGLGPAFSLFLALSSLAFAYTWCSAPPPH